ncbi:hypothetical protein MIND_01183200 [Mycena indigotica]|uniref:Uncharacterized protein n=1 Tax=Mycena indigotica TaxID=2126181 RepID=A0A8H6S6R9_9AGAR|nr:uncharacterized protein MIND_01183200 [Mycena indigotica]KAF7292842.1 hypothetical protein MIND_01183200 [Mycena indigotica]
MPIPVPNDEQLSECVRLPDPPHDPPTLEDVGAALDLSAQAHVHYTQQRLNKTQLGEATAYFFMFANNAPWFGEGLRNHFPAIRTELVEAMTEDVERVARETVPGIVQDSLPDALKQAIDLALAQQIEQLSQRLDTKIENVGKRLDEKLEQLDGKFEQLDGKFERLDEKFERLDGQVNNLQGSVKRLENVVVELNRLTKQNMNRLRGKGNI